MGDTTDELLTLAKQMSAGSPAPRAGHAAHVRRADLHGAAFHGAARAGGAGHQLHREPERHHHRRRPLPGAHRRGPAVPHPRGAGAGEGGHRRRLPGRLAEPGGHDARARRERHHRGRPRRGARGRGLRDLLGRGRRLLRRSAGGPGRPEAGEPGLRRDAGARGRRRPGPQRPGGGVRAERGHRHRGAEHPRGRHRLAHRPRAGAGPGGCERHGGPGPRGGRTPGSSPSSVGSPRARCACGSWPGAAAGQAGSWWSFRFRTCTGSMRSTRACGTWGPSRARGSGPSPSPALAWGRTARSSPVASGPRQGSGSTCARSMALRCS